MPKLIGNAPNQVPTNADLGSMAFEDNKNYVKNKGNNSEVEFTAGTVSLPSITTTGDTNTGIFFPAADTIAFTEGGVEAMRIDSSGRVGIGSNSPTEKLVLRGASPNNILFSHTNGTGYDSRINAVYSAGESFSIEAGNAGGTFKILSYTPTGGITTLTGSKIRLSSNTAGPTTYLNSSTVTDQIGFRINTGSLGQLEFLTSNTERMRITAGGNVGIGTSSPTSPLMVQSNEVYPIHVKGANAKAILVETTGGETELAILQLKNSAYTWNIEAGRRANTLTFYAGTVGGERMCIDNSGNVGIGTTTPDALLSVNGVASFGDGTALLPSIANFGDLNTGMFFPAADTIAFSEGGTEAMRITSDGRLGIGTTSPSGPLHVFGSSPSIRVENSNATTGTSMIVKNTNTNFYHSLDNNAGGQFGIAGAGVLWIDSAHPMVFATNNSQRMRIDSSGAMLLGTTTAGSASAGDLVVNGGVFLGGSAAANELDDYEEGTWTPSIGGTATYTLQQGNYTKIGRQVTIQCILIINLIGTGNLRTIDNLPFTVAKNGQGSVGGFSSLSTSLVFIQPNCDTNDTTTVKFATLGAAAAATGTANIFQNSSRIDFTLTYFTS